MISAQRNAAQRPLGGVVRQADVAILEKADEGRPAFEHVVHCLGDIVAARQLGPLFAQPALQIADLGTLSSCRAARRCSALVIGPAILPDLIVGFENSLVGISANPSAGASPGALRPPSFDVL